MKSRKPILTRLSRLEAAMPRHTCQCTWCMDGQMPTYGFTVEGDDPPLPQQCRVCGRLLPITHLVTYRIVDAPKHEEETPACAPS